MLSKKTMCLLSTAAVLIGLAAFSNAASAACTPKHNFTTIDKGKLTVAVSIYAPYSGLSSAGEVEGVDGDIVKKIAA